MNNNAKIKAVLFDSGRVLNESSTGHWFISPEFFRYVSKEKYNKIPKVKIDSAFREARRYIDSQALIETEADEYGCFIEFYRIFAKCLPELTLADKDITNIAKDLVYNRKKHRFYDDVAETLTTMSQKYKLAIVSDTWPSLEGVYVDAGLRHYFNAFVISSQLGVTKPNPLMYETALKRLNVEPHEAVFIDDNVRNCEGARNIGINTVLMARNIGQYIYYKLRYRDHTVVHNLKQVSI